MTVKNTKVDGFLPVLEIRPPGHWTMIYRDLVLVPEKSWYKYFKHRCHELLNQDLRCSGRIRKAKLSKPPLPVTVNYVVHSSIWLAALKSLFPIEFMPCEATATEDLVFNFSGSGCLSVTRMSFMTQWMRVIPRPPKEGMLTLKIKRKHQR